MKLSELKEMAIKGGDLRAVSNDFAKNFNSFFEKTKANFKHIGDIENFSVYSDSDFYILMDDGKIIFICKVSVWFYMKDSKMLDSVWLDSKYEGKNIFSKMLWFLRSREGFKKIVFGDFHSNDTYNLLKKGGLSKFNKVWFNTDTEQTVKFSADNIDDFYSNAGRGKVWKLILESNKSGDELTEDVKDYRFSYVTDVSYGFTNSSYDWQIE